MLTETISRISHNSNFSRPVEYTQAFDLVMSDGDWDGEGLSSSSSSSSSSRVKKTECSHKQKHTITTTTNNNNNNNNSSSSSSRPLNPLAPWAITIRSFAEVFFLFACMVQACSGVVEAAQSTDSFLASFVLGRSYAVQIYPLPVRVIAWSSEQCHAEVGGGGGRDDGDDGGDDGISISDSLTYSLSLCLTHTHTHTAQDAEGFASGIEEW